MRKQANNLFLKNPCLASKRVLDPRCYVNLSTDKNTMDQHKSSVVFDPFNNVPQPPLDGLPPAPPICKSFTSENLSFSEFKKVLNSRRNGSAPGINMIPYKYINCVPIFVIICFVCLNLVLKIVLYLFNGELLLRFIFPRQTVQIVLLLNDLFLT